MLSLSFIIPLLLVGSCAAKKCINLTVPINVRARQGTYAVSEPATNEEVAFFIQDLTTIKGGGNFTERALTGYQTVTGLYNISATFCKPDANSDKPVVQVLSHGMGNDSLLVAVNSLTHVWQGLTEATGTTRTITSATATSTSPQTSTPTVPSSTTALESQTHHMPTQSPLSRRQLN